MHSTFSATPGLNDPVEEERWDSTFSTTPGPNDDAWPERRRLARTTLKCDVTTCSESASPKPAEAHDIVEVVVTLTNRNLLETANGMQNWIDTIRFLIRNKVVALFPLPRRLL